MRILREAQYVDNKSALIAKGERSVSFWMSRVSYGFVIARVMRKM